MNGQEIAKAILTGELTMFDLGLIRNAYLQKADAIQRTTRLQFHLGDKVRSRKFGDAIVVKVNPKNIVVATPNGMEWRCSPSLLEKIS